MLGIDLDRSHAFERQIAAGCEGNGLVEPPLRLTDVRYADDGAMTYPHHTDTAPIEALQQYLAEARHILATAATTLGPAAHLSDDFDHLRWFTLPEACLS